MAAMDDNLLCSLRPNFLHFCTRGCRGRSFTIFPMCLKQGAQWGIQGGPMTIDVNCTWKRMFNGVAPVGPQAARFGHRLNETTSTLHNMYNTANVST